MKLIALGTNFRVDNEDVTNRTTSATARVSLRDLRSLTSSSLLTLRSPPPTSPPTPEPAEVTDKSLRNCAAASSALSSEEGSEGVLESTELLLETPPDSSETKLCLLTSMSSSLLVWNVLPPVVSRVSSISVPPKDVKWLGVSRMAPCDGGRAGAAA